MKKGHKYEPTTVGCLLCCPERDLYPFKELVLDTKEKLRQYGWPLMKLGDTIRIPTKEKASVTPISDDSIMFAYDAHGVAWKPVLHNGEWYKQRAIF